MGYVKRVKRTRADGTRLFRWQACWNDPDGKERSRNFERKLDAERFLTTVAADVIRGQYIDPAAGQITFKDYAEAWRTAQPHRKTTAKSVRQHLEAYTYSVFGPRQLASIRPTEMQAWLTRLTNEAVDLRDSPRRKRSKPLAPSTARTVFNTVKAVFRAAMRDRLIAHDPCVGIVLPKVPPRKVQPLPVEQVRALIDTFDERYRAMIVLVAGTGLRQGEAFGIQLHHVDFLRRTLTVEQQVQQLAQHGVYVCPPKTQASYRTIPLPQVVVDALAEHLARHPAGDDGFIFTAPEGGAVVRSSFTETYWRPAVKRAGLPAGTGFHALRHFYASCLIDAGASVKVVQARLGHASAKETLDTYSHLWPDDEDRTRAAVDGILGGDAGGARLAL